MSARLPRIVRGVDEAGSLDGEDRQHAGHQIKYQAAEEGSEYDTAKVARLMDSYPPPAAFPEEPPLLAAADERLRELRQAAPGLPTPAAFVAGRDDDDAGKGLFASGGEVGGLELDGNALIAAANLLRRCVKNLVAFRKEADAFRRLRGFGEIGIDNGKLEPVGRALHRRRARQRNRNRCERLCDQRAGRIIDAGGGSTGSVSDTVASAPECRCPGR